VGAKYALTERLDVRIEWEEFTDTGESDITEKMDITQLSGGLAYSF